MSRYAEPTNFYADSSEDEASGHSSIFHASICIAEEESIHILEKGKQSWTSGSTTTLNNAITTTSTAAGASGNDRESSSEYAPTTSETRSRARLNAALTEEAFGTSVDSCATLVPNLRGVADALVDANDHDNGDDDGNCEGHRNTDTEKLIVYNTINREPLYVYARPKEPTEAPPILPGSPTQRRPDTLAEILFRQDMQTYGLHVSTSTAAMTYFRRNEYHEALRATDFNFRAVQSQQRTYGDLRNHPFYHTIREDTPLLRSNGSSHNNHDGRRRYQRRNISETDHGANSGTHDSGELQEPSIWTVLLEIFCCIPIPDDRPPNGGMNDWR